MNIFIEYRKFILKKIIKNPSLTEDVDYKSNSSRYRIYKKQLSCLSDDEILDELEFWLE